MHLRVIFSEINFIGTLLVCGYLYPLFIAQITATNHDPRFIFEGREAMMNTNGVTHTVELSGDESDTDSTNTPYPSPMHRPTARGLARVRDNVPDGIEFNSTHIEFDGNSQSTLMPPKTLPRVRKVNDHSFNQIHFRSWIDFSSRLLRLDYTALTRYPT